MSIFSGKKEAVLLDWNGTITDPGLAFSSSFLEELRAYTGRWESDGEWSPEKTLAAYNELWDKQKRRAGKKAADLHEAKRRCLVQALRSLPIAVNERFTQSFLHAVKERQHRSPQLRPAVREMLERLAGRYRLAIVSNGSRDRQIGQIQALGLAALFPADRVFAAELKSHRKPAAYLFEKALEALGLPAEKALMVGNSWRNDVTGAVRSGLDAVWLHPAHKEKNSRLRIGRRRVLIIRTLEQLQQFLD